MRHRPKRKGLWVELTLSSGKKVDGIMRNDLMSAEPWNDIRLVRDSKSTLYRRKDYVSATVIGVIGGGQVGGPGVMMGVISPY